MAVTHERRPDEGGAVSGVRFQVEDAKSVLSAGFVTLADADGHARWLKRTSHRTTEVKVYEYVRGDPSSYVCVRRY